MSRAKSDTYDNIFSTRTPERKTQKHKCSEQQRLIKLQSPLPQKEGMNPQNYLILTPNRENLKCNQSNCMFYTPQRGETNTYSSTSSSFGSAFLQGQYQQRARLSLDVDDYYEFCQFGTYIEPFALKGLSSTPGPRLESEKEDITRLRKDSINPIGKDLEMQEGLIQSQPQLALCQSQSGENGSYRDLDPQLVMQEIESAWLSLESTSPPLINSFHS